MLPVLQSSFVPGYRNNVNFSQEGETHVPPGEMPHIHQAKQEPGRRLHQGEAV